MISDTHNRIHNYLRISLTDNCNLRCFYCMPDADHTFMPSSQLMQAGEIDQIAREFIKLGTNKIRLTGGEPLVRKDADGIIRSLSSYPVRLSLTTNGVRLHEFIDTIREAYITSINVSLDTLQADKFQFIEWTKHTPVHIRFIEFMPFTGNRWMDDKVFTWQDILGTIETKYSWIKLKDETNDTTKKYMVPGHQGTFAVISTMTSPFCSTCNRMRLTADGRMKNCLFSKDETDLLSALRRGEDIVPLILGNVQAKAAERGGQFVEDFHQLQAIGIENRSMIAIGG